MCAEPAHGDRAAAALEEPHGTDQSGPELLVRVQDGAFARHARVVPAAGRAIVIHGVNGRAEYPVARVRVEIRGFSKEIDAAIGGDQGVLVGTDVLADMLVEAGARRERVHVIGNGAVSGRYGDTARDAAQDVRRGWSLPGDAFVLGFVGYMRPWHRLDLVLDVMQRPGLEALHLVLMGEGPALAGLRQSARDRGMQDRVRVLGVVPPESLPSHVMACDGALIPAINDYASPLKLFDSLAASVVTVAPDQANLRENIVDGESGLLFAAGDADGLAAQLLRVVADRGLAQRIGANGRQSLEQNRWTWAGNADRVLDVFRSLSSGGAR